MTAKKWIKRIAPWSVSAKRSVNQGIASWRANRALNALNAFMPPSSQSDHGLSAPLVVSLTSYPPRYPVLACTIKSLLLQNVKADKVVLWLAENDQHSLPDDVLELVNFGLQIRICKNLRSYKKIIPSLSEYSDSYIVTADDDAYYPPNWLKTIVDQARLTPRAIVGTRGHIAKFAPDGHAKPYAEWTFDTRRRSDVDSHNRLFLTGIGGIIYPPAALPKETLNEAAFQRLCPMADDIWLFAMSELAGIQRIRTPARFDFVNWPRSQECGLVHENVVAAGNDSQFSALEAAYPALSPRNRSFRA
ncbi:glycosyltransferase family 2 protein [Caulobacter segnis]|uniref:Glycosyltransferase n=1 Tax=Caulobacter segnis (strain ATCC 21756 / DSM 7131 / JCM 7823 / NBRC 15250 / LMG 17158 / TK0059) TaxID=509190 RepID=D5VHP0_CAUST|nr:glycosyltransferase family 2 protein [Caulobacter segnis]ADG09021.1 glycosyltransferase [Caulobacter segnis ATCC 21756]